MGHKQKKLENLREYVTVCNNRKKENRSDAHLFWQHFAYGFPVAIKTSYCDHCHSRVKRKVKIKIMKSDEFMVRVKNGVPTS